MNAFENRLSKVLFEEATIRIFHGTFNRESFNSIIKSGLDADSYITISPSVALHFAGGKLPISSRKFSGQERTEDVAYIISLDLYDNDVVYFDEDSISPILVNYNNPKDVFPWMDEKIAKEMLRVFNELCKTNSEQEAAFLTSEQFPFKVSDVKHEIENGVNVFLPMRHRIVGAYVFDHIGYDVEYECGEIVLDGGDFSVGDKVSSQSP